MARNDEELVETAAEQAAAWFARQESGSLSEAEFDAFQSWLTRDPEHAREYEAIERMWSVCDHIAPPALESVQPSIGVSIGAGHRAPAVSRSRRFRPAFGGAIAAALCLFAVLGFGYGSWWRADLSTAVGEVRTVSLQDGSTVVLNTDSAIKLHFTAEQRVVELLAGEADFRVAPDRRRPFIVEAGGGRTRALGTEFVVRRDQAGATVTVLEHEVAVTYSGSAASQSESATLLAGQRMTYGRGTGLQTAQSVDPDRAAQWRRGMLSFEDRPLGEIVDELDRYLPGWIRMTDPELRDLRVTCVIPLDQPVAAMQRLAQTLQLRTVKITDYVILIRKS